MGKALRFAALLAAAGLPLNAQAQGADLFHSFERSPTEHGFYFVQSKDDDRGGGGRVSLVPRAREGSAAVKLTTFPGDSRVHGSGSWERTDLAARAQTFGAGTGAPRWWANSLLLPDDFHMPRVGEEAYLLMDWHDDCPERGIAVAAGQAPFNLEVVSVDGRPVMRARVYGGDPRDRSGQESRVIIDPAPRKNVWYDFVHEVRWAADASGVYRLWMRADDEPAYRLVLERVARPNLYAGCRVYFKLANYHGPYGVPSSVIHDRVASGMRARDVALAPLEGLAPPAASRRRLP